MSSPRHIASGNPFESTWYEYHTKGWSVVPLPENKKKSPPGKDDGPQNESFTGRNGRFATEDDYNIWAAKDSAWHKGNIAIRAGNDVYQDGVLYEVIGIDVDAYDSKNGREHLLELEKSYGPLPSTWTSSARADGVSGIRWYLAPKGYEYMGKPRLRNGKASDSIEIVQRVHRYGVVFPSYHPELRTQYWWYATGQGPDGVHTSSAIPRVEQLAVLPDSWFQFLTRQGTASLGDSPIDMDIEIKELNKWAVKNLIKTARQTRCTTMTKTVKGHLEAIANNSDHHDPLVRMHWSLIKSGAEGHEHWAESVKECEQAWMERVATDNVRSLGEAKAEIARSREGALRKLKGLDDQWKADGLQFLETSHKCATKRSKTGLGLSAANAAVAVSNGTPATSSGTGGPPTGGNAAAAGGGTGGGRQLVAPPSKPSTLADFLLGIWEDADEPVIVKLGEFYKYNSSHWVHLAETDMLRVLYSYFDNCLYEKKDQNGTVVATPDWDPDEPKLRKVMHALMNKAPNYPEIKENSWFDGTKTLVIPCLNGLVRVEDRVLLPHTPNYFCTYVLEAAYDPEAKSPKSDAFIRHLAGGDQESARLLYDWMGYVVAGTNQYQKGLIIKGKSGCGKGVYARLLHMIVGRDNYAGYKVADFKNNTFAKEPLVGKSLVVFSDNRSDFTNSMFVDLVLEVVGQDTTTLRMPYARKSFSVYLPCRFMILTNLMPSVADDSGAFVRRFVTVDCKSEPPKEIVADFEKVLYQELPGMINRMLSGLANMKKRGGFKQPESSRWILDTMQATSSVEHEFVNDKCILGLPGGTVYVSDRDEVYTDYLQYCSVLQQKPLSKTKFCESLIALGNIELHKQGTRRDGQRWVLQGLRLLRGNSRVTKRSDLHNIDEEQAEN